MRETKKQLKEQLKQMEINERLRFLDVYSEFNTWLRFIGFRTGHYWNESSTHMDVHYSYYSDVIDSLHSVEHYVHDILKFSIRFLRDRNKHYFVVVGEGYSYSEPLTIDQFKEEILNNLKKIKDHKLSELNSLVNI
jgi:hypothetical protein